MSRKSTLTPIAAAIGTTFVVSLAASPIVNAAENPFALNELSNGYMVTDAGGKCGEAKCGESKAKNVNSEEEKASEAKCGNKMDPEGKCGEGKCGEKRKAHEGKCGNK